MTQSTTPNPPAPPADSVTLTINGKTLTARKGTLLVEAARQVGLEIPVFCYHPKLKPVGACRMCLVQIDKMPRLQTACTTPVAQDMVVHTNTPEVVAAQNGVIEFLLANHPLDCPICDKGGECPLQDQTFRYGLGISRFTEGKRHLAKALPLSDRIVLDRERCIMCYRCVRFHQEIPGDEALAAVDRGAGTEIGTLPGESYDSVFSGNTIELCPVGALTSRTYRFKARPWDLVRTPSICNGCAVGCNITIDSRTEKVLRLRARLNPEVDDGWLCDAGRFDTLPDAQDVRPSRPRVRNAQGVLEDTSWENALTRAAVLLGDRGGALVSGGLSNEALWLLQTTTLGAESRLSAALWPAATGDWPVEGRIDHLPSCRRIVLVGLDAWNELPVLALWIRKAALRGATLVVIGAQNGLYRDTAAWLQAPLGHELETSAALLAALQGQTPEPGAVDPDVVRAAATALGAPGLADAPAAFLVHPRLLQVEGARATLERLARQVGANGEQGLVGASALAANGRGAQDLAPDLAQADPASILVAAASGELGALLLLGDEAWGEVDTGAAQIVLASSRIVPEDPRIAVVLPMAHPYERQGSLTNLEGRVQLQEGGALPPQYARADWSLVGGLANALAARAGRPEPGPVHLEDIRARLAASGATWAGEVQAPLRSFVRG